MIYNNLELYNVQDIVENKGDLMISRLPNEVRLKMWNPEIAFDCVGVEFRFRMIDDEVKLKFEYYGDSESIATMMYGSMKNNKATIIKPGKNEITIKKPSNFDRIQRVSDFAQLPFGTEIVRILLNSGRFGPPEVIGQVATPENMKKPATRYLAYGSSITAGASAILPDMNYVSRTAALLGAERINLGFSGSAKLEAEVARYIAAQKGINYLSMELGVNVVWDTEKNCWGDPEAFRQKVKDFIPTVVEGHKDIPIVCIDIFLNSNDVYKDPEVFEFRDIVREEAICMERKNKNFKYVCGKDLLTKYDGLSYDLIHPSVNGAIEIGDRLYEVFQRLS